MGRTIISFYPLPLRILASVKFDTINGCWLWTGAVHNAGYGKTTLKWRTRTAHSVAYEAFIGPVPAGKQLDHTCRVRRCCNPWHVEPVTLRTNLARGRNRYGREPRPWLKDGD